MKDISELTYEEVAAVVSECLNAAGLDVVLCGGGCVAIWSDGQYTSYDLDFIERRPNSARDVAVALESIGFVATGGREFRHPQCSFYVELPPGPPTIDEDPVTEIATRETAVGAVRLLTPTDAVKDRLAAYFYWHDTASLQQAILVARRQTVDLERLEAWAARQQELPRFREFERELSS